MGNICRSPAAEIIFHKMVSDAHLENAFTIDSAGTYGGHAGAAPDPRMQEILKERGYKIFGKSRKVTTDDLEKFDLILAMDRENYADLKHLDASGNARHKIKLMTKYCTLHKNAEDVPDPYHGGKDGFVKVAVLLEDACAGLLKILTP